MKKVNFNINNFIRDNIKAMKPYSSARDEFKELKDGMVFLDANENPFENGVNRYPDPQQTLVKNTLAKMKGVETNQILLGNGSDEVLDLVFRAFCEPNKDNVIILPPTYGMYKVLANINAVDTIEVQLTSNFQPKAQTILLAAKPTSKILFLCSPNNPSGNSFSKFQVEKLLKQFKGIVVIDEAYIDFSEQESWLNRLNEFPNLIVIQTFSKACGMAGIRLGACYASPEIISILNRIKPPYNVNELTQLNALNRLNSFKTISEEIKETLKQRAVLIKKLNDLPFVKKIYPSDANFLLVKVDDATTRYSELIKKGIVVRNRTKEINCENCLRLTVGTPLENTKLIRALKTI